MFFHPQIKLRVLKLLFFDFIWIRRFCFILFVFYVVSLNGF